MPQCPAITATGSQCRRYVRVDGPCYLHLPGNRFVAAPVRVFQCRAINHRGSRCGRLVRDEGGLCVFHRGYSLNVPSQRGSGDPASPPTEAALYAPISEAELQTGRAQAGLDEEIAMLRVLIKRAVDREDIERARRAMDSLTRLYRTRHDLRDDRTGLRSSLDRVLDAISAELDPDPEPGASPEN